MTCGRQRPGTAPDLLWERTVHRATTVALLGLSSALAITSLLGDSITFDETGHLVAGVSHWALGDFRLIPDHPPLGKLWAALPLLPIQHRWPEATASAWVNLDWFELGRQWLFDLNDGQRLLVMGRCMIVLLLLAVCLATSALARRLWGSRGGMLALFLATLSPTLLAHGRLVTTDMAITSATALTFLGFARVLERVTWGRLVAAALALTAASLSKFSWPLLVPGLAAMTLVIVARRRPLEVCLWHGGPATWSREVRARGRRLVVLGGAALFTAAVVWLGIWTAFRWRYDMLAPVAAGAGPEARADLARTRALLDETRAQTLLGSGSTQTGPLPAILRFADTHRLLPESYVLGLAQAVDLTAGRYSYLRGEYGNTGWRSYFPLAFAIKTPIATQLLVVAGLAALVLRRAWPRDGALLVGLLVYAGLMTVSLIDSRLNIGHRHMLPLYPVLFVLAGAGAAWLAHPLARVLVGAAAVWLLAATLTIHPHYLSYFNEFVGGPARGHLYLADSNIDWGQDLLRLRDYARAYPTEPVKLAYFGSARPTYYLPCTALPSHHGFEPRAELTPGLYAISATQLVGVYFEQARDAYWRAPRPREEYARLARFAASLPPDAEGLAPQRTHTLERFEALRAWRLINRLGHRPPDARVGWSLFVYHLDEAALRELTAP